MTKKKLITIIVSSILAVLLITTAVLLIIANSNREKTETTIMSCSVNPSIQFVLNGNDKVLRVVALNEDGENIAINGDFVGLKADKAAELFIKLSTEAGYIELNTTGTKVDIKLTGLKNNYSKLKDQVVTSVNKYFDENGIIAGAVAKIEEDIKNTIKDLKPTAMNTDGKNDKELIQHYIDIVDMIDNDSFKIRANELDAFFGGYDGAVQTYQTAKAEIEAIIADIQAQINALADQNSAAATALQQRITTLQNEMTGALNAFERTIGNLANNLKITEAYITSVQNNFQANVTELADAIADHRAAFNANKADTLAKIESYRATLNA